jgi:hypothetical protein
MAETSAATELHEFLVPWLCGGAGGWRPIRAPDAKSAERDLHENPSRYGLAHESVIVGRALRRVTIEAADAVRD